MRPVTVKVSGQTITRNVEGATSDIPLEAGKFCE